MPENHDLIAKPCDLFDNVSKESLAKLEDIKTAPDGALVGYVLDYYWLDLAQPQLACTGKVLIMSPHGIKIIPFSQLSKNLGIDEGDLALDFMMLSMDEQLSNAIAAEVQGPKPYAWDRARIAVMKNAALLMPAPPHDLIEIAMEHGSEGIPAALRLLYQSGLSAHARLAALSTTSQMAKTVYDGQRSGIDPSMRPAALLADINVAFASDEVA